MLYLKVDELLKKNGKSKYWLSKQTGIAANHISKMCNGETTSVRFDSLEKICITLNCSLNDIFYSNDSRMNHLLNDGME